MGIEKLLPLLSKTMSGSLKGGEAKYQLMQTIMSGSGKTKLILEDAKAMQSVLPEQLNVFTQGLKKPNAVIRMKSGQKGAGVAGIKFMDGENAVAEFAVGFDQTRGAVPIFQLRGNTFVDGQKIESFTTFFNPNVKLNSKNVYSTSINKSERKVFELFNENNQLAQSFNYSGKNGIMSNMAKDIKGLKPAEFKKEAASVKDFWLRKGKETLSVTSCEKELLQIAQMSASPTIESVTKAKDILLKRMGYDPKLLPIKIIEFPMNTGACFSPVEGKLAINKYFLDNCNHTEVALLLSHELQHMDDFVKLSKSIGVKGLQKLHPNETVNKTFYEQMSKYAGELDYNQKQIIEDIKAYYSHSKYKGRYAEILRDDTYSLSIMEYRARQAERKVLDLLRKKGVDIKTKCWDLDEYGRETSSMLRPALERLEAKLPKEGRDKFFNRRYAAAYKRLEPELYALEKKGRLTEEEFSRLKELYGKYAPQELKAKILWEMDRMLNFRKT